MIIVTGASRGLGQAITERLVESGEEVIGLARNNSGLNIYAIECDVSNYDSVTTYFFSCLLSILYANLVVCV